jgi:hypothetical protein
MLRIRIGFIEDPDPDPSILGQCGSGSRDPDILCILYPCTVPLLSHFVYPSQDIQS